jgi:integrase
MPVIGRCRKRSLFFLSVSDLRDSYAYYLLTADAQLVWILVQLGHSDVATTARHYARWTGGDLYREPLHFRLGDVSPDFLARIEQWRSQ